LLFEHRSHCNTAPTTDFAEIVSDDFPTFHVGVKSVISLFPFA
jgi:hypothetical protein